MFQLLLFLHCQRVNDRSLAAEAVPREKNVVLTGSPYKKQLEEKKQSAKVLPKVSKATSKSTSKEAVTSKKKDAKPVKKKTGRKTQAGSKSLHSRANDDTECLYCQELFSKSAARENGLSVHVVFSGHMLNVQDHAMIILCVIFAVKLSSK